MIQLINIGKLSKELQPVANKYQKMISWEIKNHEISHSQKSTISEIKRHEAELIQSKILVKSYIISLDVLGIQMSSEKFSTLLSKQIEECNRLTFIIGGAFGLDETILKLSHLRLSLSNMTFPHQLTKIILLEQIYRAKAIIEGHPYHK